ncbi:phosphoadenylyl-sulfate reductase [Agaribacter flavus]|uniref:Phosphoadenosine 5'-phosphosulfate reductase n=1 Tax=Agaribacter flavus TaxID=1902781 RepID=A0ABV7FLQ4_9ALTE
MSNAAQVSTLEVIDIDIDSNRLLEINQRLNSATVHERVEWAMKNLPATHIVSSSFGAQSAVMLHLMNEVAPNIPVVLTDTGYLFSETYLFIEELTARFNLNLKVYRAAESPAWQEAKYGQLWEKGVEGLEKYNTMNKVEPMKRALSELSVGTWFAGLRRSQSDSRMELDVVKKQAKQFKVHPIVDQSNKQLHQYMTKHKLPYNPLWDKGYVSIGDWHSTTTLQDGMSEQDTRFFGLKRECGLHEFGDGDGI